MVMILYHRRTTTHTRWDNQVAFVHVVVCERADPQGSGHSGRWATVHAQLPLHSSWGLFWVQIVLKKKNQIKKEYAFDVLRTIYLFVGLREDWNNHSPAKVQCHKILWLSPGDLKTLQPPFQSCQKPPMLFYVKS